MLQLLRYILFPVSLLYAAAVHVRNLLFDIGIFKSETFSTPTITIGNLSVGGTGKTPMVAYLIELLGMQCKIAVLSRGYKRKSKGFVLANNESDVYDLGDEPFQIARKYSNVSVAVDANRRNGIQQLEKLVAPDLIILDDAYQHRWVKPSLSFLLTSHDALYPRDWYLPTGDLRDAKNQSKRADLIIVTKCPKLSDEKEKAQILNILKPTEFQTIVFGELQYEDQLEGISSKIAFQDLEEKKVALVTGIANPKPLVDFLGGKQITFEHLRYSDHHDFTDSEIQEFKKFDIVITTEKDFVRLDGRLSNAYFIRVEHHFSENDRAIILEAIQAIIPSAAQPSA